MVVFFRFLVTANSVFLRLLRGSRLRGLGGMLLVHSKGTLEESGFEHVGAVGSGAVGRPPESRTGLYSDHCHSIWTC